MTHWEPTKMKSQLRLTAQRLGQLQDRIDSQAQITRKDIATLLQYGNVALARAKAQKLLNEDALSDLLQTLEMHVGMIIGHMGELERKDSPSPVVLEAAASIVIAAPQVDCKELRVARDILTQRLGPEFVYSVKDYVSNKVRAALSTRPASAGKLDQYMFSIAQSHGIQWTPSPQPQQIVDAISGMLDTSNNPIVDMTRLHIFCSQGLPEDPRWLRPKVWRLLLGTLPAEKKSWSEASRSSRENYYDLVRRLLDPFSSLPPPTSPLAPLDESLLNASQELSQVPPNLMLGLQEGSDDVPLCPLDDAAPADIRIACAKNLDERLRQIRQSQNGGTISDSTLEITTPEIRLEDAQDDSSDDSDEQTQELGSPAFVPPSPSGSSIRSPASMTLLHPRAMGAHPKHASALLRLLYLHACLNPANQSAHIGSLLVPVYSALVEEVVPEDAAHVEADAFWLFEVLVGEFTALDDADGGRLWTRKLSERLLLADPELAEDLQVKGLDPALPHYSFRWIIPVLTHTLPLRPLLSVWDAILSRPMRERDSNPKLEFLVDICTSMLLRTRNVLLRLGRPERKLFSLWSDEIAAIPSTPLAARELEDAFAEGMTFLQQYPLDAAGGIEAVLQGACDLANRHQTGGWVANMGISARLRDTVWSSFTKTASLVDSGEDHADSETTEDEDTQLEDTDHSGPHTLTARLANTVWRGISNESAMDAPPSPTSPVSSIPPSPVHSPPLSGSSKALPLSPPIDNPTAAAAGPSKFWGYAEKLKDSDAAATLAKVSTNWKVKALDVWNKRSNGTSSTFLSPSSAGLRPRSEGSTRRGSLTNDYHAISPSEKRRAGSLPRVPPHLDGYSPPARPAFFRPPRDSVILPGNGSPLSPTNGDRSPASDTGSLGSGGIRASLSSLGLQQDQAKAAKAKSGPRPLLLNSASLITNRSPTAAPLSSSSDKSWSESIRGMRISPAHRDSASSFSSFSPVHSRSATLESDTGSSRIVPLRSSRSPMARGSGRITPTSSTASSPHKQHRRMDTETSTPLGSDDGQSSRGWTRVDTSDSAPTGSSPPPPQTPADATTSMNADVRVKASTSRMGSPSINVGGESDRSSIEVKPVKEVYSLPRLSVGDTSDSSTTQTPTRSPRLRQKRLPPRLSTARSRENVKAENGTTSHDTLATGWSDDVDGITTPRATTFQSEDPSSNYVTPRNVRRVRKTSGDGNDETRTRKLSGEGREVRVRKVSTDGPTPRKRKVSGEREVMKHSRESSADEGDDEGYKDLLSAYESED